MDQIYLSRSNIVAYNLLQSTSDGTETWTKWQQRALLTLPLRREKIFFMGHLWQLVLKDYIWYLLSTNLLFLLYLILGKSQMKDTTESWPESPEHSWACCAGTPIEYSGPRPGRKQYKLTLCSPCHDRNTIQTSNPACKQRHLPRQEQRPTPPAKTRRKAKLVFLGRSFESPRVKNP